MNTDVGSLTSNVRKNNTTYNYISSAGHQAETVYQVSQVQGLQ